MKQFFKTLVIVVVVNVITVGTLAFVLSSNDFIENQVKLRWDKESNLYLQGYSDGRKEVLDSVQYFRHFGCTEQ